MHRHWPWLDESTSDFVFVGHWFCTFPEHQLLAGHASHTEPFWKNELSQVQGHSGVLVHVPMYDALDGMSEHLGQTRFVPFVHMTDS